MSREYYLPGDYKPAPEDIQEMFVGFAELRARAAAKRVAREIAHPETTTELRRDEGSGPRAYGAGGKSGRGRS